MVKNAVNVIKGSDVQNPFESRLDHLFKGYFLDGNSFAAKLKYCKGDTLVFEKRNGMRFLVDLSNLSGLYEIPPKSGGQ